jgi:hypothetical protein
MIFRPLAISNSHVINAGRTGPPFLKEIFPKAIGQRPRSGRELLYSRQRALAINWRAVSFGDRTNWHTLELTGTFAARAFAPPA